MRIVRPGWALRRTPAIVSTIAFAILTAPVLWGAGADADDVVQDAFVKAYSALTRYRASAGFRAWLLSIVHNETRNLHRGRGRRAARESLAQLPDDLLISDPEEEAMIDTPPWMKSEVASSISGRSELTRKR